MAYGDIGGAFAGLVITCKTPSEGEVNIKKGDAVCLMGENYTVGNNAGAHRPLFGQAVADSDQNDAAIPVKVRGVFVFKYHGDDPWVDGHSGVNRSVECPWAVIAAGPGRQNGAGLVLAVYPDKNEVHVLI